MGRHSTAERLEEKNGLLREFRSDDALWSEYQTLLAESVVEIRRYGYSRSSEFQVTLRIQHVQTIAGRELNDQQLTFLGQKSASLSASERL